MEDCTAGHRSIHSPGSHAMCAAGLVRTVRSDGGEVLRTNRSIHARWGPLIPDAEGMGNLVGPGLGERTELFSRR